MNAKDTPVIVEEIFNSAVNTVWNAITNLDEMKQWYFNNIPSFKPEIGFTTEFEVKSQDRIFTHLWTITEVDPLKKIVTNWKYKEYQGNSFVYFELFEKENKTLLRVTSKVSEPFPDNIPEFKSESCREGWNYFIKQNLKNYLNQPKK